MRPVVHPGLWLLRPDAGRLADHRARYGSLPVADGATLADLVESAGVLGRGGAGFPFAVKLRTTLARRGRRHTVVNVSEGEPASAKDAALVLTAPHLVLDGAALVAAALGSREVHLVVPRERPWVARLLRVAVDERAACGEDRRLRWTFHQAAPRFVAGESSAVLELVQGRENLPVTSWAPAAVAGIGGRPTMLSNAETFAQVAALALAPHRLPGTLDEPGTRLLSVTRPDGIHVHEVPHGADWAQALSASELASPVLLGGYHGQWVPAGGLRDFTVSAAEARKHGFSLGAGIVLPTPSGVCPLVRTADLLGYLAGQSAGRCGPCVNGLPALADAFSDLVDGRDEGTVGVLSDLVEGRGACAHPDGTARLARSALGAFPDEVAAHRMGVCTVEPVREVVG